MTKLYAVVLIFFLFIVHTSEAQISESTDFEQFTVGTNFTQTNWQTAGFSVPWVNGFNQNRAVVDGEIAKSGTNSIRLFYPKGEYGPSATGGQAPLLVEPKDELYASYQVRFSKDFSWGTTSEGGNLPGLSGGARCSGCAVCTGLNGFTARLMWRHDGKAVLYLYHLHKVNPPCGDNYELIVDGKNLLFEKEVWYKISQRVKVNTGTNLDGEVQLWVNDKPAQLKLYNGNLVDKLTGIQFVSNGDKVDGLYFSTFHGGSNATWSPTVDSYTWFDDIIISDQQNDVVENISAVKKKSNNEEVSFYPNPTTGVINLPENREDWVVYDARGYELFKVQGTQVDFTKYPKGIYLIKSANASFKIVKQ
jgi:hypothetical protein